MAKKRSSRPPAKIEASSPAPDRARPSDISDRIYLLNGTRVILDADLATFFETTTSALNQYRARNEELFAPDYAFQLSESEWEDLRSQNVISSAHGGRRYRPWAFTEHGVMMMSMGMKSQSAIRLSRVIIDTFIEFRRGTLPAGRVLAGPNAAKRRHELAEQIYATMTQVLKLPVTSEETLGEALGSIATRALSSVKALVSTPALKADVLSAEAAKIIAEADKLYAETRRIHEETNSIAIKNKRESLALLRDLRDLAAQLERDEWAEIFDESFGDTGAPLRRLASPRKAAES